MWDVLWVHWLARRGGGVEYRCWNPFSWLWNKGVSLPAASNVKSSSISASGGVSEDNDLVIWNLQVWNIRKLTVKKVHLSPVYRWGNSTTITPMNWRALDSLFLFYFSSRVAEAWLMIQGQCPASEGVWGDWRARERACIPLSGLGWTPNGIPKSVILFLEPSLLSFLISPFF